MRENFHPLGDLDPHPGTDAPDTSTLTGATYTLKSEEPDQHASSRGRSVRRPDLTALLAQDSADRLDRMAFGAQLVDEPDDQRLRGSSSPAKKIEARRRISLSSSSLRTFAFRSLISTSSSLVAPNRCPPSI